MNILMMGLVTLLNADLVNANLVNSVQEEGFCSTEIQPVALRLTNAASYGQYTDIRFIDSTNLDGPLSNYRYEVVDSTGDDESKMIVTFDTNRWCSIFNMTIERGASFLPLESCGKNLENIALELQNTSIAGDTSMYTNADFTGQYRTGSDYLTKYSFKLYYGYPDPDYNPEMSVTATRYCQIKAINF